MACDKNVMETCDHMVYECSGWIHGFINKISTNEKRSPAYKYTNSISHWTQSGYEVIIGNLMAWSYRADYEEQPHMREYYKSKLDYAICSLMDDPIDILKELYTEEWAIYQDFLNLNPMAATFAWLDLCNQVHIDIEEGFVGDPYKTPALFKIQFHTAQHKIACEE